MAPRPLIPAAQYLRMSAEHQRYSLDSQARAIAAYAASNGLEVIRSYVDAGISGLELEPRDGLKQLLTDVIGGAAPFQVVLVFDVSRWGRFQDPDEAAHYEFLCRASGVRVTYCAEAFANDTSLASTLMKHIKRAMAAEYLQELSAKVARAQRGVALQGFWRGGAAPYGFRRQMIRFDGVAGPVLDRGERKAIQGYRIKLVRGPDVEVQTVERIFRDYAQRKLRSVDIARQLNAEGVPGPGDRSWKPWTVRLMLRNEAYVGTFVLNQRRVVMRKGATQPRDAWVRVPKACPRLVSDKLFAKAQARISAYHCGRDVSDDQLLDELQAILAEHGRLSMKLIEASIGAPRVCLLGRRFGSQVLAYERAGCELTFRQRSTRERIVARAEQRPWRHTLSDEDLIDGIKHLLAREGRLNSQLINEDPHLPSASTCLERLGPAARLYERVGYAPYPRQQRIMDAYRRRREVRPHPGVSLIH